MRKDGRGGPACAAADGRPVLEWFETRIVDDEGGLVARVRKQVYVRRRPG